MTETPSYRLPALLVIMDGFGIAPPGATNAVSQASTPNLDRFFKDQPFTTLDACGRAVGLPEGQMGNSEVGHLNIGAGQVVFQELTRIDRAIEDGSFMQNDVLRASCKSAVSGHKAVHLMGLVSNGGVHSSLEHLKALITLAAQAGADKVFVHAFLDGRDVSPTSGAGFLRDLRAFMDRTPLQGGSHPKIATVIGRYYAMDRDNRWERVKSAYDALAHATGMSASDPAAAVEDSYARGVTDEFVEPLIFGHHPVQDGDTVIFFNFRPDRARELTRAFTEDGFTQFDRGRAPSSLVFVSLTEYDPSFSGVAVAFPKELPHNVLADVLARKGLRQYHTAETEKYAHVTFFFNGGVEAPKAKEERVLIASPKVATYDLRPEMSAPEVARTLHEAIDCDVADVYIVNFANCDMVGHTGVLKAAIKAVEAVDTAVGLVVDAVVAKGGFALITADHGNAEKMVDACSGDSFTAHTVSRVPLALVDSPDLLAASRLKEGRLCDVAPTLLAYAKIDPPSDWTGKSLLVY